jgi:hypothetical protein
MEIPSGIQATAAAIQRGQARFDRAAGQVVADTESMARPEPADGGDLARDLVGMDQDALMNSVLYGVFRRQQEQQSERASLVRPADR